MYIRNLICENTGPIESTTLYFNMNSSGNPVPCVIVGENGSGKSILLSFIADSFFEFAEPEYQNATKKIINGHEYFKMISSKHIRVGANYYASYLDYINEEEIYTYFCKSGKCSYEVFATDHNLSIDNEVKKYWKENESIKNVSINKEKSKEIFTNNVLCYFPPSRYEKPNWLGSQYYDDVDFSSEDSFEGHLKNPILVSNVTEDIMQWLFDIIADSRGDLDLINDGTNKNFSLVSPNAKDLILMSTARKNVEAIMSTILGQDVVFRMGYRGAGKERFQIYDLMGKIIVPSLDALSTGQMALFLLFATIARYADHLDINNSIHLNQIKGIVVIDEIDLHLHSRLQREVVPKLMKLFPKVQFVISTHSPLVLLGLKEEFGDDVDIIEMPSGRHISAEQFNEFEKAYSYYSATERFRTDFRQKIDELAKDKPLVITEGATDWRHIKAAFNSLSQQHQYEWIANMDFELLEYDPENSDSDNVIKIQMSADELKAMVTDYSKLPQPRKMIFIADNDKPEIQKKLAEPGKNYKSWGNNVFSMIIPVPKHRIETPNICIEHLYYDNDIKQWVETVDSKRRIFLGNEFNKDGFYLGTDYQLFCRDKNSCGSQRIQVIDGNGNKKVIEPYSNENEKNFALSKMEFAKMILAQASPFNHICFEGFIELFKTIKEIIEFESYETQ